MHLSLPNLVFPLSPTPRSDKFTVDWMFIYKSYNISLKLDDYYIRYCTFPICPSSLACLDKTNLQPLISKDLTLGQTWSHLSQLFPSVPHPLHQWNSIDVPQIPGQYLPTDNREGSEECFSTGGTGDQAEGHTIGGRCGFLLWVLYYFTPQTQGFRQDEWPQC